VTALTFIMLIGAARPVEACICGGPTNTCGVLSAAATVLEATVISTEVAPSTMSADMLAGSASFTLSSDVRVVSLGDVTVLRGAESTTVVTARNSSSCGYEFTPGTRYLIVANRTPDGQLSVSRCGLTRPLAEARGLREYFQRLRLSAGPQPGQVWGWVRRASRWIDFTREFTAVPDAEVTFEGPVRRSIRTGADGYFLATNLTEGHYAVTVTTPPGVSALGRVPSTQVDLAVTPMGACQELGFVAPIISAISGAVVDEEGRPVANAFVTIRLPDQNNYSRGSAGGGYTTGADGRYEFTDLPPGRYAIGVNSGRGQGGQLAPGEVLVLLRFGERRALDPLVVRRRLMERH
jgi:hypothetical protein